MMVIVISSSFFLMSYLNDNLKKEIYKSNKSLLTQIQIYSDTYLIERVHALVTERFLDISQDKYIYDFFSDGYSNPMGTIYRIHANISNTLINNGFIDSIYVYRKSDQAIVSSREGFVNARDLPRGTTKGFIDVELINKAMSSPENRIWVSPYENFNTNQGSAIISLTQSIPMLSSAEDRLGCIVININEEAFFNSISKISDTNDGELMVIDQNGKIFAHNNNSMLFNGLNPYEEIRGLLSGHEGFAVATYHGKPAGVSWVKSSLNDWYFVSIVPLHTLNRQLMVVKQFSIIVLAIIIILGLMGLNIITNWLYKPLKTIIYAAKDKFTLQDGLNDLELIRGVIANLSTKVEEMESLLQKNEGLIENKIATDMLNGNFRDESELNHRLYLIKKTPLHNEYILLFSEINKEVFLLLPVEQREYVTYKMIEIINKFYEGEAKCISISNPSHCIVTIVNYDRGLPPKLSLPLLAEAFRVELGLFINIAVSTPLNDVFSLREAYTLTGGYLKYSFIYGYGNIFTPEAIDELENNKDFSDLHIMDRLEAHLKSNRVLELKEDIINVVDLLKDKSCSFNYTQSLLLQITNLLYKISREQGITTSNLDKNKILSDFNNIRSLEAYKSWLFELIDIYDQNIRERNVAIDIEFIAKIKKYITNNINNQLSLNSVADEFNISPGYLSKIFKEGTGTNFSDFVINKKFEKAAELLLGNNHLDISEVAETIGYSNITYFTRLFKEKYGMTPLQYRKKNV